MDFVSSIKRNMTTAAYAQFDGRASRSEYWWFYLFTVLATAAADMLSGTAAQLGTSPRSPSSCLDWRLWRDACTTWVAAAGGSLLRSP